jgi:hypothetical protein
LHVFRNISLFWDYLDIVKFWRLNAYIPACYLCKTCGKFALGWISMLMISYLGGFTDFFLQCQPFNRKTCSEYVGLLVFQQTYMATCIHWTCNRLTFAKAKCLHAYVSVRRAQWRSIRNKTRDSTLREIAMMLSTPSYFSYVMEVMDRFCGLVVRVLGYRPRGPGPIPGATRLSEK